MNTKGTEKINEQGAIETKVETVDIQSPPGENKEPRTLPSLEACNMNTKPGTEKINEQGAIETKVETVDIQFPPGENKEPRVKNVEVVHLTRDSDDKGGVLAGAADAVAEAFQSAKDTISSCGHGSNK
ncbi:hypothetical protein REPUB_Repub19eG0049900 [Reevesia pubescens]